MKRLNKYERSFVYNCTGMTPVKKIIIIVISAIPVAITVAILTLIAKLIAR